MPSALPLPVHHGISVEGHEKHLATSSRSHGCKKYLFGIKNKLVQLRGFFPPSLLQLYSHFSLTCPTLATHSVNFSWPVLIVTFQTVHCMEILLPLCFLRLLFIAGLLAWDNDYFYKGFGTLFLSLVSDMEADEREPLNSQTYRQLYNFDVQFLNLKPKIECLWLSRLRC